MLILVNLKSLLNFVGKKFPFGVLSVYNSNKKDFYPMKINTVKSAILGGIVSLSTSCSHVVTKDAPWASKISENSKETVYQITKKAADSLYFDAFNSHLTDTFDMEKITLAEPKQRGFVKNFILKCSHKPKVAQGQGFKATIKTTEYHQPYLFADGNPSDNTLFVDSVKISSVYRDIEKVSFYRYSPTGEPYGVQKEISSPNLYSKYLDLQQKQNKYKLISLPGYDTSVKFSYKEVGHSSGMDTPKKLSKSDFERVKKKYYSIPKYE